MTIATTDIRAVFEEQVAIMSGRVTDCVQREPFLIMRSVLPTERDVTRGDSINGGVALQAGADEIVVNAYLFRQVCRNGAILSRTIGSVRVERDDESAPWADQETLVNLRDAIEACSDLRNLSDGVERMRAVRNMPADSALHMLSMLGLAVRRRIGRRFARAGDDSLFGLVNAVTAQARDTRSPSLRWRLEDLGGGILAAVPLEPFDDPSRSRAQDDRFPDDAQVVTMPDSSPAHCLV